MGMWTITSQTHEMGSIIIYIIMHSGRLVLAPLREQKFLTTNRLCIFWRFRIAHVKAG